MQTSTGYSGPWKTSEEFTIPKDARDFSQKLPPITSKARYWRLWINDNYGAKWGMGFNKLKFFTAEIVKEPKKDDCNQHVTCDSCIYSIENMDMIKENKYCGWCSGTATCMMGDPVKPTQVGCDGKWLWTSCSAKDGCLEYDTCASCTAHLDCGWCETDNKCRGGNCKSWAGRSCGKTTLNVASQAIGSINSVKEEQIKAQIVLEKKEKKKRTELIIGLGGVVTVLSLVLVGMSGWQKKQRKIRRDRMKEVGCQWDDDAENGVEFKTLQVGAEGAAASYQNTVESEDAPLIN